MVSTKLAFVFSFTLFFLFVTQVSAMLGSSGFVEGFEVTTAFESTGISVLDLIIGVVNNIGIFIALLGTSSEFFLFGSVLVTAYVFSMIYLLVELLRGV